MEIERWFPKAIARVLIFEAESRNAGSHGGQSLIIEVRPREVLRVVLKEKVQ